MIFRMSDAAFALLALSIAFLLLTQLVILNSLKNLSLMTSVLTREILSEHKTRLLSEFESEAEFTGRRVQFRARASLVGRLMVSAKTHEVGIEDISVTGARIRTAGSVPLTLGASYPISILIPGKSAVEAVIRVVRELDPSTHFGGCFEDLPLEAKGQIKEFVNDQAKKEVESSITPKNA